MTRDNFLKLYKIDFQTSPLETFSNSNLQESVSVAKVQSIYEARKTSRRLILAISSPYYKCINGLQLFFLSLRMCHPRPLYRLISVFSNKQYKFYKKLMWKNVHPVSGTEIWTHNLLIMSDQGSCPMVYNCYLRIYFHCGLKYCL